jgi:hypothetical protein
MNQIEILKTAYDKLVEYNSVLEGSSFPNNIKQIENTCFFNIYDYIDSIDSNDIQKVIGFNLIEHLYQLYQSPNHRLYPDSTCPILNSIGHILARKTEISKFTNNLKTTPLLELINYTDIEHMSLINQCTSLNLPFYVLGIPFKENVEKSVLFYFLKKGYLGTYLESFEIILMLRATILDLLYECSPFYGTNFGSKIWNSGILNLSKYLASDYNHTLDRVSCAVKSITNDKFLDNIEALLSDEHIKYKYPNINSSFAVALFNTLSSGQVIDLIVLLGSDYYTFRNGWPDVTIIKDGEIKFIEVKTFDKLHKNQIATIPVLSKILTYEFCVLQVNYITDFNDMDG